MQLMYSPSIEQRQEADLLVIPFFEREKKAVPAMSLPASLQSSLALPLESGDFTGGKGETLLSYLSNHPEKRVLLVGLGAEKDLSAEAVRQGYAKAVAVSREKKFQVVNVALAELIGIAPAEIAEASIDALLLSNYGFSRYKTEEKKESQLLTKATLLGKIEDAERLFAERQAVVEGVCLARDLVNENSCVVTTDFFCTLAEDLAKKYAELKVTIYREKELEELGMGLLLAVGRGAEIPPRFIIMEYRGDPSSIDVTALVGKGMTYDTGGLNIKPTGSMETMRSDMGGAAAVFGTMQAALAMKLKRNIIGVVATAENSVDAKSYKPGDIYKGYKGLTVEIANTDAEGRLILADALSFVEKNHNPTRIIDLATLTGAIVVALGHQAIGLFSNNDELAGALSKAGDYTHERLWRMPLYSEFKEQISSQYADLKNSGGREGGSITAALFLQKFVEKTPWAHLDIAGRAVTAKPEGYCPSWARGAGVRLLIRYLQQGR